MGDSGRLLRLSDVRTSRSCREWYRAFARHLSRLTVPGWEVRNPKREQDRFLMYDVLCRDARYDYWAGVESVDDTKGFHLYLDYRIHDARTWSGQLDLAVPCPADPRQAALQLAFYAQGVFG